MKSTNCGKYTYIGGSITNEQHEALRRSLAFTLKCLEALETVQSAVVRIESLLGTTFDGSSKSVILTRVGNRIDKLLDIFAEKLQVISGFVQRWATAEAAL